MAEVSYTTKYIIPAQNKQVILTGDSGVWPAAFCYATSCIASGLVYFGVLPFFALIPIFYQRYLNL